MQRRRNLQRLLHPRSIAVCGGRSALTVIKACQSIGYTGELFAVNPHRERLGDLPCYAQLEDLPAPPDATFLGVPAQQTIELVDKLASMGAGGAVCFASGFAELSATGSQRQALLLEAAQELVVMGPNCHGFVNYLDGVALWPDHYGGGRVNAGVALVVQSGNIGINLTMQRRGLSISYVVAIGNQAQLEIHEVVDYLLEDPRVTAIGLHIEGLRNLPAFCEAAIKALNRNIPLVILKTGSSPLGAQLTLSHTSSMAGSDALIDTLLKRFGIARCTTLPEFIETLKFVSITGTLTGTRIGSMSCSGGEASHMADLAEAAGLELPPVSPLAQRELVSILGDKVHISNPLDYHNYAWGDYDALARCFAAMIGQDYDCTVLILDYPWTDQFSTDDWQIAERALIAARDSTGRKVVVVSSLPENFPPEARQRLLAAGIAPMQGIAECLKAIVAAALIGRQQAMPAPTLPLGAVGMAGVQPISCSEFHGKQRLQTAGVAVPEGRLCNAASAVATARAVGYPVAVKTHGTSIAHKSDRGGVCVNLQSDDSVTRAVASMAMLGDQFLVEKMVGHGVAELVIGICRDELFGLALTLGAGGTLVELMNDTCHLLLPASRQEIEAALASLKLATLIKGHRGRPAGDWNATLDAIERLVSYATANHLSLLELEVNPLLILPEGKGVVAVDVLLRGTDQLS